MATRLYLILKPIPIIFKNNKKLRNQNAKRSMKFNCKICDILVAEIKHGSHIRKGTIMVCSNCFERLRIADKMAQIKEKENSSANYPEFFKNLFDNFNKK